MFESQAHLNPVFHLSICSCINIYIYTYIYIYIYMYVHIHVSLYHHCVQATERQAAVEAQQPVRLPRGREKVPQPAEALRGVGRQTGVGGVQGIDQGHRASTWRMK